MAPVSAGLSSASFDRLRTEQDLVLSRHQLAQLGVGRQLIARRVTAATWQTVGPHIVVLHGGELTRRQQLWAGVLHAGPDACLDGLSVLEVEGLTGFESPDIITVVAHGRGRRDLVTEAVTVRVVESRTITAAHKLERRSPPRLRQELAAIRAAATAPSERACRTILAMVVQQRLASAAELATLAEQRPNLRRRGLILETLSDVEGGSESLPELEYLDGLRRFGLPLPTRQQRVRRNGGHYVLDADFDPWLVTAEVNGVQHLTLEQKQWDDTRRTRLAIGGRLIVDISSHTVRHDITLAVLLTADALLARGWNPPGSVRERLVAAAARAGFLWTSPAVGGAPTR